MRTIYEAFRRPMVAQKRDEDDDEPPVVVAAGDQPETLAWLNEMGKRGWTLSYLTERAGVFWMHVDGGYRG